MDSQLSLTQSLYWMILRFGVYVKYTIAPSGAWSFLMYNTLLWPAYILITPNPSVLVHKGKISTDFSGSRDWGARTFLVAGLKKVYWFIYVSIVERLNRVNGGHTVVLRSRPAPLAETLTPPLLSIRFGLYLEITTVISSACWFMTQTNGGIPLRARRVAPINPYFDRNC